MTEIASFATPLSRKERNELHDYGEILSMFCIEKYVTWKIIFERRSFATFERYSRSEKGIEL